MPLCGIDEAGRGPLAGPLYIAGVILNTTISGLNDSKKLTEKQREALYPEIIRLSQYYIVRFDAKQIDEFGISRCLAEGLEEIMLHFGNIDYLYDGNSTFGVKNLKTMIKADAKISEVSAASILAKVQRDREMIEYSKLYPEYQFNDHKGYGTKDHISAIKKYGYSPIHRISFKIKALQPTLF